MSSMIHGLTGFKLIFQIVVIVANGTVYSTNDVNGCRKIVLGYVVTFGAIG